MWKIKNVSVAILDQSAILIVLLDNIVFIFMYHRSHQYTSCTNK
jgi:hypothetical protein